LDHPHHFAQLQLNISQNPIGIVVSAGVNLLALRHRAVPHLLDFLLGKPAHPLNFSNRLLSH
jgi:hypothetical protein